jgi:O-Antigen ligase
MDFPLHAVKRTIIVTLVPQSPSSSDSEFLQRQRPLEMFRARARRVLLHPAERMLLALLIFHLVAIAWCLGGLRIWAQIPSLILSAITLIVALKPRTYTESQGGDAGFRLVMWPRLFRFPLFWIGIPFLLYIAIQGLNPAWVFTHNERGAWWMTGVDHIDWLPAGVTVPLDRGGPGLRLIMYTSVWLTVCALWVGITRRRSLNVLFTALAVNGIILCGFALAQRLLGNGKMFWFYESPNSSFFGSFTYKNHAGAYLNLTLGVALGIASWYYLRGLRRLEKSNPASIFVFFATFIAINILVSYSRGATMAMLLFLTGLVIAFLYHQFTSPAELRRPIIIITMVILFGFFLKTGMDALNTGEAWTRFAHVFSGNDLSAKARMTANKASLDMLGDYWISGSGAGSFKFLYPTYQQNYPEIWMASGRQLFWDHAQ